MSDTIIFFVKYIQQIEDTKAFKIFQRSLPEEVEIEALFFIIHDPNTGKSFECGVEIKNPDPSKGMN